MATITLTADQLQKILDDADKKVEMLTVAQIEVIATKLNEHINIPILSERGEQVVFAKIVKKIDRFLYSVLPNELYELVNISTDGISDDEAELIKNRVAHAINKEVNLPFIGEDTEESVFRFVVGLIIDAMKMGSSLI